MGTAIGPRGTCGPSRQLEYPGNPGIEKVLKSYDFSGSLVTLQVSPFPQCDPTISIIYGKRRDQQILNKLHSIHPSTAHWAAVPVRRHDVRLTRLRIGHTRLTHRYLMLGESPPGYSVIFIKEIPRTEVDTLNVLDASELTDEDEGDENEVNTGEIIVKDVPGSLEIRRGDSFSRL
ncbi:hypothetical protein TNCV_2017321 [Trichonephila clavipes]|nr:hypothetical protein TNCV_2017321 [Trichonephila clavipes]